MRFTILSLVGFALLPLATHAEGSLDEIVVTAQRVFERLQDVPVAVTAISANELIERGVRQAGDITASVPNLLLNSPYGPEAQPTFTLRGVTAPSSSSEPKRPLTSRSARAWVS
jgi:outer membrane receptor protein involved in Fe transport